MLKRIIGAWEIMQGNKPIEKPAVVMRAEKLEQELQQAEDAILSLRLKHAVSTQKAADHMIEVFGEQGCKKLLQEGVAFWICEKFAQSKLKRQMERQP